MGRATQTVSTEFDLQGTSVPVHELKEWLSHVPAEAELRVSYSAGDPRNHREHDSVRLKATWPLTARGEGGIE